MPWTTEASRPGWCGVHVTQYEQTRRFDVVIKDASPKHRPIGNIGTADGSQSFGVTSRLPYVLMVSHDLNGDMVLFDYASAHWGSNDQKHHCVFSPYSGSKRGDCGFTC